MALYWVTNLKPEHLPSQDQALNETHSICSGSTDDDDLDRVGTRVPTPAKQRLLAENDKRVANSTQIGPTFHSPQPVVIFVRGDPIWPSDLKGIEVPMTVDGVQVQDYWSPVQDIRERTVKSIVYDLNYYIVEWIENGGIKLEDNENLMSHFWFLKRLGRLMDIPTVEIDETGYTSEIHCGHACFMVIDLKQMNGHSQ